MTIGDLGTTGIDVINDKDNHIEKDNEYDR